MLAAGKQDMLAKFMKVNSHSAMRGVLYIADYTVYQCYIIITLLIPALAF